MSPDPFGDHLVSRRASTRTARSGGREDDPAYDADLLRLELALRDRDPSRDLARLRQVVARRPAGG